MSKESNTNSGGVGFLGLLTILFIGLKLTNHIDWSWWWVFAPCWGPLAIVIAIWIFFSILKAFGFIR